MKPRENLAIDPKSNVGFHGRYIYYVSSLLCNIEHTFDVPFSNKVRIVKKQWHKVVLRGKCKITVSFFTTATAYNACPPHCC